MQNERLYRPRPPEFFKDGIVASLDVDTNVVTYNIEVFDLKETRDRHFLNLLDENETYLVKH